MLATVLMLFVLAVGPTIFILETFLQNTGSYLNNIVERTFNLQAYSRNDWIGNWTLFIFGWTISGRPSSACSSPRSAVVGPSASLSSA